MSKIKQNLKFTITNLQFAMVFKPFTLYLLPFTMNTSPFTLYLLPS